VVIRGKSVFEYGRLVTIVRKPTKLSVRFGSQLLTNPLILASGILGTEAELLARVANFNIGAITTKSCCLKPRLGHENPTVLAWEHGLINAVGLTNPGVEAEIKEIYKLKRLLSNSSTKIIASFFGATVDEFKTVAGMLAYAHPDFLEVNISCPNTEDDLGRPFACSVDSTYTVVKAIKEVVNDVPIIVKLSPNVTDIIAIGKAASEAGADALSAINTVTGMVIDIKSGKPILTNKVGGLSGPAIKPIAVRCVYQLASFCQLPIIGLGGITTGEDAIEMIMAGATAVGVGSAVYYRGINCFAKITKEMTKFMKAHQYKNLDEIRGIALK